MKLNFRNIWTEWHKKQCILQILEVYYFNIQYKEIGFVILNFDFFINWGEE